MPIIRECGEMLVDLKKACPHIIISLDSRRLKREKTVYLRETVAGKLRDAQRLLPKGMAFIVNDAWRPQAVQREILKDFRRRFSHQHPSWASARIAKEVNQYVALAAGTYASGHLTGGAVDLRLWYNGRKVPMKSARLSYQENALSNHPKLPVYLKRNRQILFDALTAVGLSNYPKEFWHWSYGDIWWAKRNQRKIAIYGVVENPLIQ